MNEQNPRQLQGVADLLATRGRYGDSMMVHMNPIEVQGLASMSPTGSLTVNPDTGQPEAFLPFLIPLLGGIGGSALAGTAAATTLGIGGLSATALGAIGSGLGSFAATGDLKQGIMSGITGFGIGSALGGAAGAATTAETAVAEAGKAIGHKASDEAIKSAIAGGQAMSGNLGKIGADAAAAANVSPNLLYSSVESGKRALINPENLSFGENLGRTFSKDGLKALASPTALIGAGVGEGSNMMRREEEYLKEMYGDGEEAARAEYDRASGQMNANMYSRDIAPAPYDPLGSGSRDYGSEYAGGGIVSLDPSDFEQRFNGLLEMGVPIKGMLTGGFTGGDLIGGYYGGGIEAKSALPSARQASLRGVDVITPGELDAIYDKQGLPGFGPEINYFRDPLPEIAPLDGGDDADGADGTIAKPKTPIDLSKLGVSPFISAILARYNSGKITAKQMREEITEGANSKEEAAPAAEAPPLPDPNAAYGSEYTGLYGDIDLGSIRFNEGGEIPSENNAYVDRLIEQAQAAVLGNLSPEESEVIINQFIEEFGQEAFMALREMVLEQVVPNSQKEGEITGVGGGMDDLVQGMIGSQQPVAVSPGEYIVPADVVSGLGDGSTDSGVQELDRMLDRVRVERTNTTKQPAPLFRGGVLPA